MKRHDPPEKLTRGSLLPSDSSSDEELVLAARQSPSGNSSGNLSQARQEAFRVLMRRHWKVVVVVARNRLSCERDAEDVAQEAFVKAFKSLESLQNPAQFLSWLLRITGNLAIDYLRRRRPRASIEQTPGVDLESRAESSFQERVENEEEVSRIKKALKKLPDRYQTVLTLRYIKGMSNQELASALDEPEGTIRNRQFRALAKLRDILGQSQEAKPRNPTSPSKAAPTQASSTQATRT